MCLCPVVLCAVQRDQELAAAVAAAASVRESSSLPTSPTARALRSQLSGGPNSTGSVASPLPGLSGLVIPSHQGHMSEQEQMAAELERSKASVARLLKERDDLDEKLKAVGKELKQAINEKSVQVSQKEYIVLTPTAWRDGITAAALLA